jgi:hypothetical protein
VCILEATCSILLEDDNSFIVASMFNIRIGRPAYARAARTIFAAAPLAPRKEMSTGVLYPYRRPGAHACTAGAPQFVAFGACGRRNIAVRGPIKQWQRLCAGIASCVVGIRICGPFATATHNAGVGGGAEVSGFRRWSCDGVSRRVFCPQCNCLGLPVETLIRETVRATK